MRANKTLTFGLALALAATIVPQAASAQHWRGSWGAAPQRALAPKEGEPAVTYKDMTIRQTVRISAGGDTLRIRLSNELSALPQLVGEVTVAVIGADGKLRRETLRNVTFSGASQTLVGAGAPLVSDPISLKVSDLAVLAISIHLPEGLSSPTVHGSAYATGWAASGRRTSDVELTDASSFTARLLISGVDVSSSSKAPVIVTFGDSITDGTRTTVDANRRWPDRLAERLHAGGKRQFAVVNVGIGANRLLEPSSSPSALARFDRDVLAVPGVSHVIVLIGTNDIGNMRAEDQATKADRLIAGYRQLIARARAKGVRIYLGTIIPFKGAKYWTEAGEEVRKRTNAWIRTQTLSDGVIDFDRAMADPADPDRMRPALDIGDALHPNDAGMEALAGAVDLATLGRKD
jgi:lysophospholipase L1-like esterase